MRAIMNLPQKNHKALITAKTQTTQQTTLKQLIWKYFINSFTPKNKFSMETKTHTRYHIQKKLTTRHQPAKLTITRWRYSRTHPKKKDKNTPYQQQKKLSYTNKKNKNKKNPIEKPDPLSKLNHN